MGKSGNRCLQKPVAAPNRQGLHGFYAGLRFARPVQCKYILVKGQNPFVAQPPEHGGQRTAVCGEILRELPAVKKALQRSGKLIPWQVCTVTTDGRVLENA